MSFIFDKMYCGAVGRGDVVIADFDGDKKALLVLQDKILNEGLPTVICALIVPYKKEIEVLVNEVFLREKETGLGKDGVCLLHKIITVERKYIVAKKGEVSDVSIDKIFQALDISLGRFRDKI